MALALAYPDIHAAGQVAPEADALLDCPYPAVLLEAGRAICGNADGYALLGVLENTPAIVQARLGLPLQTRLRLEERSYDLTITPLRPGFSLVTAREATFEANIVQALARSRALFRDLVLCSTDFAWETDAAGRFGFVSPSGALGFAANDLTGQAAAEFVAEGDAAVFTLREPLHGVEITLQHRDGDRRIYVMSAVPVFDEGGAFAGGRGVAHDVTESRQRDAQIAAMNRQLEKMARTDELTGLLNRRAFVAELESRVAQSRRSGRGGAVLFLDLDNFKVVNDTLGHAAGDACLAACAEMLRKSVRAVDLAARFGGDEFVLWMDGADEAGAAKKAKVLIAGLAGADTAYLIPERPLGFSIGIAVLAEGDSAEHVLARADGAMYDAKRSGKGSFAIAQPGAVTS